MTGVPFLQRQDWNDLILASAVKRMQQPSVHSDKPITAAVLVV